MSAAPTRPTARRLAGAVLLALVPFALVGGTEPHLGHGAAEAATPLFNEASHAGQADHWDAADPAHSRRCPDCLTPPQPLEPAPEGARHLIRSGDGSALPGETSGPTDPGSRHIRHSRAPPLS